MVVFIYTPIGHVCPYIYTSLPTLGIFSHLSFCQIDRSEKVFVVFICISMIISGAEHFLMLIGHFCSIDCNILPVFFFYVGLLFSC